MTGSDGVGCGVDGTRCAVLGSPGASGRPPGRAAGATGSAAPSARPPARATVRTAVREVVPVALSVAPFALVIGATATHAAVPVLAHTLTAAGIFAGAAHLAVLTLASAAAGIATAVGIATLVNSRLLLYSAALEPRFRGQPRWFRWAAPALIIDQTYVMALDREDLADPVVFRRYWLTAGGLLVTAWAGAVGLGGLVGPMLPAGSAVDAAAVVVLAGLLGPRLVTWRPAAVAAVALAVSIASAPLPGGLGLLAGIGAGIATGLLLDRPEPDAAAGPRTGAPRTATVPNPADRRPAADAR